MGFLEDIMKKVAPSSKPGEQGYSEDLGAIEKILEGVDPPTAKLIAAAAMILSRVVYVDNEISDGERKRMEDGLVEEMSLDRSLASKVCDVALNQIKKLNSEEHIVTRVVNELATQDQKVLILRVAFRVAADDMISEKESDIIRLISMGLGFSHREFVGLRSEFRDDYKTLRRP